MSSASATFREAVAALHREKDSAYRDAWKRRGEIVSIIANIARKVDRIEYSSEGARVGSNETVLDTAIDLFVYCLKYQTFLADLDTVLAEQLFGTTEMGGPYSNGRAGFEVVLARTDLAGLCEPSVTSNSGIAEVIACFSALEACFGGLDAKQPIGTRLRMVQALTAASVRLIGALHKEQAEAYRNFLASRGIGAEE